MNSTTLPPDNSPNPSSNSADDDAGTTEDISNESNVSDMPQGYEPGASKLDATLFAQDSDYEDLSIEIAETHYNFDGECSSRTQSLQSYTGSPLKDSQSSSFDSGERGTTLSGSSDSLPDILENKDLDAVFTTQPEPEEVVSHVDAVRKQRAETVTEAARETYSEDVSDPQWASHKKHVFILSEAGKPIYTRHGNEEKLVTLMGVMQALVSFVADNNDTIRSITAGSHKFVFLSRGPMIMVAVSSGMDSVAHLVMQLTYVYHQVLSVLTFNQLSRIFELRRNYDLRKLLSGTEKFIDNIINMMSSDPSLMLGAVRCLPLASSVREHIGQTFQQARYKDLVFAILVVDEQLVTMVRPKKYSLHPSDLHLIFNLVSGSTSFRTAESWTPICLPKFDNSGYLYAHVSYFDDTCPACLLLLSTDRNAFFELSTCKVKIYERLQKSKSLEAITHAARKGAYRIDQVGIPELWHFVYKSRSTAQFTSPEMGPPYITLEEQERLFGKYLYLHHRIHCPTRSLKILCHMGSKEMLIGWVTSGFELYAAFSPLISKASAMNAVNKLLRWIKRERGSLVHHQLVHILGCHFNQDGTSICRSWQGPH